MTPPPELVVGGIVAARNFEPYVQLFVAGKMIQLSMAQARDVARNILIQASRAEADAMIRKFFASQDLPQEAATALMIQFRDFRAKLDAEKVKSEETDPD